MAIGQNNKQTSKQASKQTGSEVSLVRIMQGLTSSVARGQDPTQANKQAVSRLDIHYENKPSKECKTLLGIVT